MISLQDLLAEPLFVQKIQDPIQAAVMASTFEVVYPDGQGTGEATPVSAEISGLSLAAGEEDKIEGEILYPMVATFKAAITVAYEFEGMARQQAIESHFAADSHVTLPWTWADLSPAEAAEAAFVELVGLEETEP